MGIRFACPACGHVLNIKSELAGKRGICPKCQARVAIPWESTVTKPAHGSSPSGLKLGASATPCPSPALTPAKGVEEARPAAAPALVTPAAAVPASATPLPAAAVHPIPAPVSPIPATSIADPIAEAPHLLWYVAPPGTNSQYGPASGDMFRSWIAEGRVATDSLVWRQDWSTWQRAGDVLPQLGSSALVVSLVAAEGPHPRAPLIAGGVASVGPAGAQWSPPAGAVAQPVIVGPVDHRQPRRKRSLVTTTNLVVVLGLLVLVLIPIMWLVLRR